MATFDEQLRSLELPGVTKTSRKEPIGTGSYANVYEVMVHETVCAAKEMHPILMNETKKRAFLAECVQCSRILHPNVVQFLGIHYPSPDAQLPWLVMELMYISLTGLIEKYEKEDFPFHFKSSILMDTCQGIQFLHSRNIVHRDLSSNNILLTKHLVAKVSDLGVAKAIPPGLHRHTMVPGTTAFMPPEALIDEPVYGLPIDVFSVGCVCVHLVSMEWPVPKNQVTASRTVLSEIERREHYLIKMGRCPSLKLLAEQCLQDTPEERPVIEEVIKRLKDVNYDHHPHEDDSVIELFKCVVNMKSVDERIVQKDQQLMEKDNQLILKDQQLCQKDEMLNQKDQQLRQKDQQIVEKDRQLSQKDNQLRLKDQEMTQKDQQLGQKDQQLSQKDQQLSQKDQQLSQKDQQLSWKDQQLNQKDEQLKHKDHEIAQKDQIVSQKDQHLRQRDLQIAQKDQQLEIAGKDQYLDQKDQQLKHHDQEISDPYLDLYLNQKDQEMALKDQQLSQDYERNEEIIPEDQFISSLSSSPNVTVGDVATITAGRTEADSPTNMSLSLPGGRRITLKQADITEETVDAIVNSANEKLLHGVGLAAAINKASNGVVEQQSTALIQQHGLIKVSQAVHTEAGGALKCKYVIHTVGPEQYKHKNKSQQLLWMACMNTLQLAEKLGVTSIAIPPISCGLFGVPKDVVAKTIINVVCHYPYHPAGLLTDVRIVMINAPTFKAFKPFFIDARKVVQPHSSPSTQSGIPLHAISTKSLQPIHTANSPSDHQSSKPTQTNPTTEECPICQNNITDLVTTKCQHKYCRECLKRSLQTNSYCPVCKVQIRPVTGDQPAGGRMTCQVLKLQSLPGYENYGALKISYIIPNGIQGPNQPRPGRPFNGGIHQAYLPDSPEGREVYGLLRKAFDAKLTFTIQPDTGRIVWSDIHHKTNKHGGPQCHGYPDPTYLKRVNQELQQKGIF